MTLLTDGWLKVFKKKENKLPSQRLIHSCGLLFQLNRFVPISKLKYYFAVDTLYVGKKLGLLVFPYMHEVSHFTSADSKFQKIQLGRPREDVFWGFFLSLSPWASLLFSHLFLVVSKAGGDQTVIRAPLYCPTVGPTNFYSSEAWCNSTSVETVARSVPFLFFLSQSHEQDISGSREGNADQLFVLFWGFF